MIMKKEKTPRSSIVRILNDLVALAHNATLQAKTVKATVACACIVGMLNASANAADITWQGPVTISGTSDVSTQGTLVGTWAPGDDAYNPDSLPVNGVTFNAYGSGPFNSFVSTSGINNHYTGYNNPGTGDNNYDTILKAAVYSDGSSISLTWGGLAPGDTYLLEFWVQDGRNSTTAERSETLTGGANTSAALAYGSGSTGPGQFILGTFVADGTTETLTLNASGGADIGPSAQVNLMQLRNISPRPSVTWQTPVTISGTSDVSTQGIYFGSWAPQDGSANTLPVNGVTFQGFSDLPSFTSGPTFDAGYNAYGSPNTSDPNYNTLLQSARYSNEGTTPATFSWSGMTPGNTYLVQFWVNDGRNIGQSRSETITGGASTSAPLSFGSDGTGPGQYIVGTFVANSSGGQTLILNAFSMGSAPSPQVNLLQVRDITATVVPRPTITRIAVSGPTLTIVATNGPVNGAFVLLQSADITLPLSQWTPVLTNSFDGSGNLTLSTNVVSPSNPREFYILQTPQ